MSANYETYLQSVKDKKTFNRNSPNFVSLVDANLAGANLESANLAGAKLYGANLAGANLESANLVDAKLYGANLESANLAGANLAGANLAGANLAGANLESANLVDAKLYGANLESANLESAKLYGANLESAKLYSANLYDITMNWQSHSLISARLRQAATEPAQIILAGFILGSPKLCWDRLADITMGVLPNEYNWAMGLMQTWVKHGDNAPSILLDFRSK